MGQLDTTIDAKRNEINNVSNEINAEKEQSNDQGQALRQNQIELLNKQIALQRNLFELRSAKTQGGRYADIATGQFESQIPLDQAAAVLEQENQRSQIIEETIN